MNDLEQIQTRMGIVFDDPALLQRAFIHRSYVNEAIDDDSLADNERLEFLGDIVLGFVTSDYLFRHFPDANEGDLTRLRSSLVRRITLARLARRLDLGDHLWLGKGEEESGGRERTATLCAVYEALVGALYIDQGLETTVEFVMAQMEPELYRIQTFDISKDAKSRLQEFIQSNYGMTPRYRTHKAHGPDHARFFTQQVAVKKIVLGVGQGYSKQEADQLAAAMALYRLGEPAPEHDPDDELVNQFELSDVDELTAD